MSSTNPISEMLLIGEPSILNFYNEILRLGRAYLPAAFLLATVIEYFSEWDFPMVIKKLVIIAIFMSFFQSFHEVAVKTSFDAAYATLKKVDPRNPFVRRWYDTSLHTKDNKSWNVIEKFVIPNLNDLLGTAFYLLARVAVWILKLIYSTVYHLTYVFAPITALLYFFSWTNKGLIGTVQSLLWCVLMPFVVVAIFAMVGGALDDRAMNGEAITGDIETIIWLFGVSLVLLLTPLITWSMVKGEGVASSAGSVGKIAIKGITTAAVASTMLKSTYGNVKRLIPSRPYKQQEEAE